MIPHTKKDILKIKNIQIPQLKDVLYKNFPLYSNLKGSPNNSHKSFILIINITHVYILIIYIYLDKSIKYIKSYND